MQVLALLCKFQEFFHDFVFLITSLLKISRELGDDAISLLQSSLKVLQLEKSNAINLNPCSESVTAKYVDIFKGHFEDKSKYTCL